MNIQEWPDEDEKAGFILSSLPEVGFLDEIKLNLSCLDNNLEDAELQADQKHKHLFHYLPGFLGCFALNTRNEINWEEFLEWKDNPKRETTLKMVADFLPYIQQKYDILTTAPASSKRNISCYCANELTRKIGELTKTPFIQCFEQRKNKFHHGRKTTIILMV